MQKKEFTLGVDVSKKTLDIHCAELGVHLKSCRFLIGFTLQSRIHKNLL
jgi:hypothetical protein